MTELTTVTKEKLIADLKTVLGDADELLRLTANQAGEKIGEVRARVQDNIAAARVKLAEIEDAVIDRTKAMARSTDDFVHENPWKSVGVAAGIAFLLGLVIGRR